MKIPNLVLGHNLDDYIAVFRKPKEFTKWLEGVYEFEAKLNEKIGTVNKLADIESMTAQVKAKLDEANSVRTAAEGFRNDVRAEIDQSRHDVKTELEAGRAEIEKIKAMLAERQTDAAYREREAEKKMGQAVKAMADAKTEMGKAEAVLREGKALKERFEDKLAKMGALAE